MEKQMQISVMGQVVYSGPFIPEHLYNVYRDALITWAGDDLELMLYLEQAHAYVKEIQQAHATLQHMFWWGNGGFHGQGWLLVEELEKALVERYKLKISGTVGTVIAKA